MVLTLAGVEFMITVSMIATPIEGQAVITLICMRECVDSQFNIMSLYATIHLLTLNGQSCFALKKWRADKTDAVPKAARKSLDDGN